MGGNAVTLDTVSIKIESEAGAAIGNVNRLATALGQLKDAVSGGFASINNLADYLENLSKAANNVDANIGNIKALGSIVAPLNELSNIKSPTGLSKTMTALENIPNTFNKFDPGTISNVSRVAKELSDALEPLSGELSKITEGFSTISAYADKYGISLTKIRSYTKQAGNRTTALSNGLKDCKKMLDAVTNGAKAFGAGAAKIFTKVNSKVKQVFLSLLGTRTLFTLVRKATSEYMNMDQQLSKEITNVWRALGAQLAPAIEYVISLFKEFVRVVYSIILALTGIDLISRANQKAMEGYGNAVKSTLGNLQKFDDLNVVEFPSASGGTGSDLIDLSTIDLTPIQWIVDAIKNIKEAFEEAFDTGQWYGVGEAFADAINSGMDHIDLDKLQNQLDNIGKNFADSINGFFDTVHWTDVGTNLTKALSLPFNTIKAILDELDGTSIGQAFTDFLKGFKPDKIINSIGSVALSFVDTFSDALGKADFKLFGQRLSDAAIAAFKNLDAIIKKIPWNEIGKKIHDVIVNIDWKELLTTIAKAIADAFGGLSSLVRGLFGWDEIEDDGKRAVNGIITFASIMLGVILFNKIKSGVSGLLGKLFGNGGGKSSTSTGDVENPLKGLTDSLGDAAKIIAVLGGVALVITTVTTLLDNFAKTGMSSGDALLLIGGVLAEIAAGFLAIAGAAKLLDTEKILTIIAVFAGLSGVLLSLSFVLAECAKLGDNLSVAFDGLNAVLQTLIVFLAAITAAALILGTNPMVLIAVGVVVASIVATLITMALTLPTILDAIGKFINTVAPTLIDVLNTIFDGVTQIIYAVGTILPPIINSIGNLFTRVFNGISKVVRTVGDVIVDILETIDTTVDDVLQNILDFINDLGPAINNFVDNAIAAITKLINFLVSGVKYLLNTVIVDPINRVLGGISDSWLGEKLGLDLKISKVDIPRFVPKLATGTNEIETEGIYHLHPGEAVVPKKYNPALGGGTNEETNRRLDKLIDIIDNMSMTNIVNLGNEQLYKKQQRFNRDQQNKYGTTNLY